MSLIPEPSPLQAQPPQSATETHRMPFTRFLDVAASILIVFLASVTAGATAFLGA